MKKITAVLLALLLVVAIFTACRKKDTVTDDAPTGSQTEQSTTGAKKDETTKRTDNGTGGPGSEKPGRRPLCLFFSPREDFLFPGRRGRGISRGGTDRRGPFLRLLFC